MFALHLHGLLKKTISLQQLNNIKMKIYLEPDYKKRVVNLWSRYSSLEIFDPEGYEYRKSPLLPEYVLKDSILFIGLNPSFTKNAEIHPDNKKIEFYPILDNDKKDITYFEKFKDISVHCNYAEWTHLDLFFLRETSQEVIEKLSHNNVDFLQEQLDITFEIIERATPRIVVVSNALASEFFGKLKQKHLPQFSKIWMGYSLDFEKDFDNEIGTYTIDIGGNKTPIIFSGMLSGQRALDIGSFERLKWQIKRILDIDN